MLIEKDSESLKGSGIREDGGSKIATILRYFFWAVMAVSSVNALLSVVDLEYWYLLSADKNDLMVKVLRGWYYTSSLLPTYMWLWVLVASLFLKESIVSVAVRFTSLPKKEIILLSCCAVFGAVGIYTSHTLWTLKSGAGEWLSYSVIVNLFLAAISISMAAVFFSHTSIYKSVWRPFAVGLRDDFMELSFPNSLVTYAYTFAVIVIATILGAAISAFDYISLKLLTKFIFTWTSSNE